MAQWSSLRYNLTPIIWVFIDEHHILFFNFISETWAGDDDDDDGKQKKKKGHDSKPAKKKVVAF